MSAPRQLLVVGAGGLGREVAATVDAVNGADAAGPRYRLLGYLDDDPGRAGEVVGGLPVLGPSSGVDEHPDALVVVCTGRPGQVGSRQRIVESLALEPDRYATLVHPSAVLAHGTELGPGTVVLATVVATTAVRVGAHVALMPAVVLTHDDVVGDYVMAAAGVRLAGGVQVSTGAYLGSGATVRENLRVGAWSTVGMGSVVLRDVPDGQTWAGVPARRLSP